jgi:hypothetical protein
MSGSGMKPFSVDRELYFTIPAFHRIITKKESSRKADERRPPPGMEGPPVAGRQSVLTPYKIIAALLSIVPERNIRGRAGMILSAGACRE